MELPNKDKNLSALVVENVNKGITFNFDKARKDLFGGKLSQLQVDSINAILKEFNGRELKIKEQLAYIYATAYHECHNPKYPEKRMTPMEEFGGQTYLKGKKYYPYYGRGFVQITWKENYEKYAPKVKAIFGVDILKNPELLLRVDISAYIAVDGMVYGRFTGKKLSDYITATKTDFPNARRIINGTDKMAQIAGYASLFLKCLD